MDDSRLPYNQPDIIVEIDLIVSAGPSSGIDQEILDPLLADALGLDSPLN